MTSLPASKYAWPVVIYTDKNPQEVSNLLTSLGTVYGTYIPEPSQYGARHIKLLAYYMKNLFKELARGSND